MVHQEFARGALKVLGDLQARKRDDYRDAEPGKILHEMRRGELAHFKLIPHTPYYGTADATILYLMVLHEAWRCTGDLDLVREFLPVAERCLTWIDKYGDRDGDGFQEYQTRSAAGMENMGWKDSGESMVYPDGTLVKGPKALCELQGYVYDAWLRMAFVYEALGRTRRAAGLRAKAKALYERFNEAFWDEASGFYALCLDGEKKKVMSVASNQGQLLWSGIVPRARAELVVSRLMKPDMWSGWGIRTLSAEHPAFNPNSYQNGSVWPHDNAIIALGFRRYGFVEEANRVARDVSGAAGYFAFHQMPELYSGLQRDPSNFPVQYLGANVPQAWAAGSAFACLQMIVGFQPDAPDGKIYIDPVLPDWMPDLKLLDLNLGGHHLDIRFWREGAETRWQVLRGEAATGGAAALLDRSRPRVLTPSGRRGRRPPSAAMPVTQRGSGRPAEPRLFRHVQKLVGDARGSRQIVAEPAAVPQHLADQPVVVVHAVVRAHADVHRLRQLAQAVVVAPEEVGQVRREHELPPRRAVAPDRHLAASLVHRGGDLQDHRGYEVRAHGVEVVVRPVEVRRDDRAPGEVRRRPPHGLGQFPRRRAWPGRSSRWSARPGRRADSRGAGAAPDPWGTCSWCRG